MYEKGQHLSLEQMTLFSVSLVLMIMVFYSFSSMVDETGERVAEDQLKGVSEAVLNGIYRSHNSYEEHGPSQKRLDSEIPKEISGEMYTVLIEGDELLLRIEGGPSVRRNIGEVAGDIHIRMERQFMGGVSSRKGIVTVQLDGDEIIIGR